MVQISTTTSTYSKPNHPNPDLISALPDSLLLHILSLLTMDQVMKTSLLSRRWRYLWKSIPSLRFITFPRLSEQKGTSLVSRRWRRYLWKSIPCLCFQRLRFLQRSEFCKFIDRCLFHHEGSKIQKLYIYFDYFLEEEYALLFDSWIHFAITCKVEDIRLYLNDYSRLPRSLYSCTTLTSLTLGGCNLNLPDSFQLGSLEKLYLQDVELYTDSIEHLSSSCPLLEEIYLIGCNMGRDLINIVIKNENVKRLEISYYGQFGYGSVMINAPTLLSLRICMCEPSVRFHFEELGSLVSAEIFGKPGSPIRYEEMFPGTGKNYLEELLYDLRHVKHLKLCSCCIQVLSFMKDRSSDILPISATCLELNASLAKWELPGISYLLESCSNLENLKINLQMKTSFFSRYFDEDDLMDIFDFEVEGYWESVGIDYPSILRNIKIIKINGDDYCNEDFVRFLLKKSKILETIHSEKKKKDLGNDGNQHKEIFQQFQATVLAYSKAYCFPLILSKR